MAVDPVEHNRIKALFREKKDKFPSHTEEQILEYLAYIERKSVERIRTLYTGRDALKKAVARPISGS
jgi:hypothetical protein